MMPCDFCSSATNASNFDVTTPPLSSKELLSIRPRPSKLGWRGHLFTARWICSTRRPRSSRDARFDGSTRS
eukprot:9285143-Pyramimonas_sp.AAC.1